jgi:hypothetical protein
MAGILMPIMAIAGQGGIIVPSEIPNLNLWYDASVSDAAYIQSPGGTAPTNGGPVKALIDKMGFGRNVDQAASNRQPLWRANQQNGLGTIQFDGINDTFTLNPIAWALSLPGQTTFIVVKLAAQANQMHVMATNTGGFTFNLNGTNWAVETGGGIASSSQGSDTTNYHYMGMIFDGSQTNADITTQNNLRVRFRYDGVPQTLTFSANANTTTSASANTLNIGSDDAGNANFLNGYIGEMMIWTRTLTATEISQVENYLKTKWGITNPVTSNLVLSYNPAVSTSYAGSGTTINSLVSPNLPGTLSNITYTTPYFSYNGSTSQVSIADNAALEPGSGNWTMEVWFNAASTSGSTVILGKFNNGGMAAHVSYSIRTSSASLFAQIGDGTGAFVNSTSYTFSTNTWYQVVYVWQNGATKTLTTYINGTNIGTVSHTLSSILNSTNPLYLGRYNGGEYAQNFNGRIGITRLYNSTLSAAEVLQNYNASRSTYGL